MLMERLKSVSNQILARQPAVRGRGEEATKQALVLPMLDALGFDIWNPLEVCPEFEADFATKKQGQKEKVDLAIVLNGSPRAYIEVKAAEVPLDGHEGQLARYFNSTQSVSLAVLTNGIEYRFFTDTGDPNVMDSVPFHVVKLDAVEQGLDILARFHKSVFSPDAIRDFATQLNYTMKISNFLRGLLDLGEKNPTDNLVRWVLAEEGSYTGRITATIVERFQPIVKDALQMVLRDIVRRSVAALDKEVRSPTPAGLSTQTTLPSPSTQAAPSVLPPDPPSLDEGDKGDDRSRIVTTEAELRLFAMVKTIFDASEFAKGMIFDSAMRRMVPIEVQYKDTSGYFAIYLNKPSCWFIRAVVESKSPWVGFNVRAESLSQLLPPGTAALSPHAFAEVRVPITDVSDINRLSRLVLAAIQKTINDRKPSVESTST